MSNDGWMKTDVRREPCAFCGDEALPAQPVFVERCRESEVHVDGKLVGGSHVGIIPVCVACLPFVRVHNDTDWPVRCPKCAPLTDEERVAVTLERAAVVEGARE